MLAKLCYPSFGWSGSQMSVFAKMLVKLHRLSSGWSQTPKPSLAMMLVKFGCLSSVWNVGDNNASFPASSSSNLSAKSRHPSFSWNCCPESSCAIFEAVSCSAKTCWIYFQETILANLLATSRHLSFDWNLRQKSKSADFVAKSCHLSVCWNYNQKTRLANLLVNPHQLSFGWSSHQKSEFADFVAKSHHLSPCWSSHQKTSFANLLANHGKSTLSMLWLNLSPTVRLCKLCGKVKSSKGLLNLTKRQVFQTLWQNHSLQVQVKAVAKVQFQESLGKVDWDQAVIKQIRQGQMLQAVWQLKNPWRDSCYVRQSLQHNFLIVHFLSLDVFPSRKEVDRKVNTGQCSRSCCYSLLLQCQAQAQRRRSILNGEASTWPRRKPFTDHLVEFATQHGSRYLIDELKLQVGHNKLFSFHQATINISNISTVASINK